MKSFPVESIAKWLALSTEELLNTCKQSRYQGSGPGGQKRNRVYSGIRLMHIESGLTSEAVDSRESKRNTMEALRKLRLEMALSLKSTEGKKEKATPLKIFAEPPFRTEVNANHFDFPIFAFRAIYFLTLNHGRITDTANNLNCTASALTRFFKIEKPVWARAKAVREEFGLHSLK